jgi:GGDEF domain-containing protein
MSDLDLVLLGTLVPYLAVAVTFSVTTAMRHNDPANRLWAGGLIAAAGAALASLITNDTVLSFETDTAGAACGVVAIGLVWSGLRCFRGAVALPVAPLVVAVGVVLLRGGLEAVGSPILPDGYLAAAGFAVAGVLELRRSSMRMNVNVTLLQVALGLFAGAVVVNVLLGRVYRGSDHLPAVFLLVTMLVLLQLLVAMRAEREGAWWSEDHGTGRVFGVHSRGQFVEAAADRLGRIQLRGGHAGLVLAEITDLVELNEAFGRRGGDLALATVADALRRHVPAWSVLGYLGVGRFAVLAPAETPERTAEIAAAVERAVYTRSNEALGEQDVPVPVLFGTSDTFTTAPDLDALLAEAGYVPRA